METFQRHAVFARRDINEKARTATLSFSSEAPVEMPFGTEILDHSAGAVDLTRLNARAPLLWNHDRDAVIGVVERAWVEGRKGQALVRFGSSDLAEEVWNDVREGIRENVSVSYVVERHEQESAGQGLVRLRATRWQPFEISIVSVPADISVGVGRSLHSQTAVPNQMSENLNENTERKRASEILGLAHGMKREKPTDSRDIDASAATAIAEGWSMDKYRAYVFDTFWTSKPLILGMPEERALHFSRMSGSNSGESFETHARNFSLSRAIAQVINSGRLEGVEREISDEVAKRSGKPAGGFWVPLQALGGSRAMSVGTASAGGDLVPTDYRADLFIDKLRAGIIVEQMGATVLTGLSGNVDIPRLTSSANSEWLGEVDDVTASDQAVDLVSMAPKGVSSMVVYSKQLLLQASPDVETLIRNDIARVQAEKIDYAAIAGTGTSNMPTGILSTSGIGSVAIGANGGAPTWESIVNLEQEVATDNADIGSLGYLTNTKVRSKLKKTTKQSSGVEGNFIWKDEGSSSRMGMLNGYRAGISNLVPSTLTKGTASGVCSAMIFGNWSDLIIGMFGALDVVVDVNTLAHKRQVRIVISQWVDIAVRHPESFAAVLDYTTT